MPPLRQVHRARASSAKALEAALPGWAATLDIAKIEGRLLTASLYRDGTSLFLYTESLASGFSPDDALPVRPSTLRPWPELDSEPLWMPMADVFHFNAPASLEHWRRPTPPTERQGRLLRLRPDKVASYVYFHYQLQEERAFPGEKYKFIALHGSLLFMYNELPATFEEPPLPGLLKTKGTPADWAEARMDQHFIPWDKNTPYSRGLPCLHSC